MSQFQRINQVITNTCLGTSIIIFGAWTYTSPPPTNTTPNPPQSQPPSQPKIKTIFNLPSSSQSQSQPEPTTTQQQIRAILNKNFILKSTDPQNYISWIGSEFSHKNLGHLAFNLLTWHSFSHMLISLPPIHNLSLIFGSAIAASGAFLYDTNSRSSTSTNINTNIDPRSRSRQQQQRTYSGLGSSGIVSGILTTCTMFAPFARASIMGLIPAPLVVLTGGYFLIDGYLMRSGRETGIGHAAHLGGGAFGAFYYMMFLRRFGGVLGRR